MIGFGVERKDVQAVSWSEERFGLLSIQIAQLTVLTDLARLHWTDPGRLEKFSLLYCSVLFATPSLAGDVIYLKCNLDVLKQTKDLKTHQILETTQEKDNSVSMVDLANKRIIGSRSSEWQDVDIVDGVVSYQSEEIEDGVITSMKASLQIDPPGRMEIQVAANNGHHQSLIKIDGDCRTIQESTYQSEK